MTDPSSHADPGSRPPSRAAASGGGRGVAQRTDGDADRIARSVVGQLQRTVDQLDRTADTLLETAADLRESRPRSRFHLVGWLLVLALAPILTLLGISMMPDEWKLRAIAAVMGVEDSWVAGSLVLFKSNAAAYDSLMLGYQVAADNLAEIRDCLARAESNGGPVTCGITVHPPQGR